MISEDEILNLILDCYDSNEDEQDPSIFEYISMRQAFTPHSMMQRRTRDIAFPMNGEVINCPYPYEIEEILKVEQNKPGVWDLLGQPSRNFDYKVKYSAPPLAYILAKNIVLSR